MFFFVQKEIFSCYNWTTYQATYVKFFSIKHEQHLAWTIIFTPYIIKMDPKDFIIYLTTPPSSIFRVQGCQIQKVYVSINITEKVNWKVINEQKLRFKNKMSMSI